MRYWSSTELQFVESLVAFIDCALIVVQEHWGFAISRIYPIFEQTYTSKLRETLRIVAWLLLGEYRMSGASLKYVNPAY